MFETRLKSYSRIRWFAKFQYQRRFVIVPPSIQDLFGIVVMNILLRRKLFLKKLRVVFDDIALFSQLQLEMQLCQRGTCPFGGLVLHV